MAQKWKVFLDAFITHKGYKMVLDGLGNTAIIAVLGLFIGILIGTIIASIKIIPYKNFIEKVLASIGDFYVWIFRGTPIIVQLLVVYYVVMPTIGVRMDPLYVGIITFGLNSGAYVSEIMRGGLLSVDKGQMEAGRALGLSYIKTMWFIIIPQAIKNILPTLGNEFITLLKDSSVVSFITVRDLTKAFREIGGQNYEYVVPYLLLAACYLLLVTIATIANNYMEKRLRKSDRRS